MPESVKCRGSSGPTIGATKRWSSVALIGPKVTRVASEGASSIAPARTLDAMDVRIRLFAMLRERAGASELSLELPEGARVRDALAAPAVAALADGLPLVMAVNREYADADAPLAAGDELALIPPVSGGAGAGVRAARRDRRRAAVARRARRSACATRAPARS